MGKAYLYWADLKGDDPALFQSAAEAFQSSGGPGRHTSCRTTWPELFVFDNRNTLGVRLRNPAHSHCGPATGVGLKGSMATA